MTGHKFQIGAVVHAHHTAGGAIPPGNYEVVRHLPADDAARDNQYRVKSVSDGHERVLRESDLD